MKRGFLVAAAVLIGGAGLAYLAAPALAKVKGPIRVGLLHSLSGPLAVHETSMRDAEVLALEEINAAGGLLGRRVEWVTVDGRSDPGVFEREADRLIVEEQVCVLIGAYSSGCRKAILPVVERADHLLIYPVAYEGLEQSPNIVYTGAAPNQQVTPTVTWCTTQLKAKSFYLIGNDEVWSLAINAIVKDQLKALGATLLGEEYVATNSIDLGGVVGKAVAANPDVILSTLVGPSNPPFYKAIRGGKVNASRTPIVSFVVAEDELMNLPARQMINDYSVCNYFQCLDRPENHEFVRKFKARYGDRRVTSDAIDTAYNSVRLWAQAVVEAETDEVSEVRKALIHQSLNAPEGVISVGRESQHTWRPFFVGRVKGDGQVEIVESITRPIRPDPFPSYRTRDEWVALLESLSAGRARGGAGPEPGGPGRAPD